MTIKQRRTWAATLVSQKIQKQQAQDLITFYTEWRDEARIRWQDQQQTECLQSLSSNYEAHMAALPRRTPGTCEWFINDQRFRDWRDAEDSRMLWVSASPGCEKSVLARRLIDDRLASRSVTASTVCYFFFRDGLQDRMKASDALTAILHRLIDKNMSLQLINHTISSYKSHKDKLRTIFHELWSILLKVAADEQAGEVVCIIDALDKCEPGSRKMLIKVLVEFCQGQKPSGIRLKFLVTSRP